MSLSDPTVEHIKASLIATLGEEKDVSTASRVADTIAQTARNLFRTKSTLGVEGRTRGRRRGTGRRANTGAGAEGEHGGGGGPAYRFFVSPLSSPFPPPKFLHHLPQLPSAHTGHGVRTASRRGLAGTAPVPLPLHVVRQPDPARGDLAHSRGAPDHLWHRAGPLRAGPAQPHDRRHQRRHQPSRTAPTRLAFPDRRLP